MSINNKLIKNAIIAFCWVAAFIVFQLLQIYLTDNKLSLENLTIDYSLLYSFYYPKAKKGDANAQGILGTLYYTGKGVEKNLEKAIYWLEKSDELGDSNGEYLLAMIYYNGYGVPKNLGRASSLFARASSSNAEASYRAGMMFYKGEGTVKNLRYAYYFLENAAEKDHQEAKRKLRTLPWGKEIEKEMKERAEHLGKSYIKGKK